MTAEEIKAIRKQLGLSMRGFAERLGVNTSTVLRWEKGRARPGPMARRLLRQLQEEVGRERGG